ncbi:MAG TPA: universal stress protein [Gemmatimonadaceae bacterium]|nr:universal stress protein [Gemmatimonadaceae bacterium]
MRLLTLRSILVATDLSETSRPALRTAARLAPLAGASLHVLHVAESQRADNETRLVEHFREAAPDSPDPSSVRVMVGPAALAIVEHAIESGADAIILGAHRRETPGGPPGSTARSVVRTASCPCLVAARELRLPLEHVLAPIDVSDIAGGALSLALSWASALRVPGQKADLVALHVTTGPDSDAAREAVREHVSRGRQRAPDAAQVEIRERIVHDQDPARGILREAAASAADLLVMATRTRDHESQELGSVSAAVVRETPCPLLLVPPAVWQRGGVLV